MSGAKFYTHGADSLTARQWAAKLGVTRQRVYQLIHGDAIRLPKEPSAAPSQDDRRRDDSARKLRKYREEHPNAKRNRCSACGDLGHNRRSRSCTQAAEQAATGEL